MEFKYAVIGDVVYGESDENDNQEIK